MPLTDRQQEIVDAAGQLDENEFTAEDRPKVDALNEWLEHHNRDPVDAEERDEAWAAALLIAAEQGAADALADMIEVDDAPSDYKSIVVTEAGSDPVTLYVHGLGRWSLRVNGDPQSLPVEALSALDDANVKYKEVEV